MQLIYLGIVKYRNMNNVGISLSSRYDVKISGNDISIIDKKYKIDNLIYGKNISIEALVGENGAGKSTVLDVIKDSFI